MAKAFSRILIAYLVAGLVALAVGTGVGAQHPVVIAAVADIAATVTAFLFSVALGNSSVYDAYWSAAPIAIALYWASAGREAQPVLVRQLAVLALVGVWGLRLTWNWARRWRGLGHEDWRYVDLRKRHGRAYWPVSFLGIHMMPTVLVFLGCLSLFPALSGGSRPVGPLDLFALLVTGGAVWIEAQADGELRRFLNSEQSCGVLSTGVWACSRHPNYLGEVGFWWGLYGFGLAADPRWWWTIVGPIAITLLFRFISIPMIERHLQAGRPDYAQYVAGTAMLVPWLPKRKNDGSRRKA